MLITASNLTKQFVERTLFNGASFHVDDKDKVGFIGRNGAGKTTLFKLLLGYERFDDGELIIGKNVKIGYLPQNASLDSEKTVYEEVLEVFAQTAQIEAELSEIARQIETEGATDARIRRQSLLTDQFASEGGFNYKSVVRSTLLGLGFSEHELNGSVSALSGGQKTRVLLAKLLLGDYTLLLLDEPTNHLDITAIAWLENFLRDWKGAFIVISHDRYFLDRITNKTLELKHCKLKIYNGNYTAYKKQRAVSDLTEQRIYENTMREIERIEGIIAQQRQWNRERNIKTAESKQKVIDRLAQDLVKPESAEKNINFKFTIEKSGANEVLRVENLACAYGIKTIFQNLQLLIRRKERVFLLGDNGCGKTTLFKAVTGALRPIDGQIIIGSSIDVGYYAQNRDDLDASKTVFDEVYDAYPTLTVTEIRNALAAFLFTAEDVFKPIEILSGGEKARISMLKLMLSGANFLLLDEPTNHLDIESREALEQALRDYEGTIFAVSHDRYFINALADSIVYMNQDGLLRYDGKYDDFVSKYGDAAQEGTSEKKPAAKESYQMRKQAEAKKRKMENTLKRAQDAIDMLETQIEEKKHLSESEAYATDYIKAGALLEEIDDLEAQLLQQYELWESTEKELTEFLKEF